MGNPVKPVGKEKMVNAGFAKEPKSGSGGPAGKKSGFQVGNERKANTKGALLGQPEDGNPLSGAVKELHSQHPHKHSDHGPHHGGSEHVRHEPLHGLKR